MLRWTLLRLAPRARPPPGMEDEDHGIFSGRKMTAEMRAGLQDSLEKSDYAGMSKAERAEAFRAKQLARSEKLAEASRDRADSKERMRRQSIEAKRTGTQLGETAMQNVQAQMMGQAGEDGADRTVMKGMEKKARKEERAGIKTPVSRQRFRKAATEEDDDW